MRQYIKRDGWIDVVHNDRIINSVTVFNKMYSYDFVIEQLKELYETKDNIVSVLESIMNRYNMTRHVRIDDIEQLTLLYNGWIEDHVLKGNINSLRNSIAKGDYMLVYWLVDKIRYDLKYAHIKMDHDNFYLLY